MQKENIKQVIKDLFKGLVKTYPDCYTTVESAKAAGIEYWACRNDDEIDRDERHGVTEVDYIQWCTEVIPEFSARVYLRGYFLSGQRFQLKHGSKHYSYRLNLTHLNDQSMSATLLKSTDAFPFEWLQDAVIEEITETNVYGYSSTMGHLFHTSISFEDIIPIPEPEKKVA